MKVAAVIPAFNEEETIGPVLDTVTSLKDIAEIIVVNDGSTDRTGEVARRHGARVHDLLTNQGKGAAMQAGADSTQADVILFLDADLIGLSAHHVRTLLRPVVDGEADMSIGVFEGGRVATDLAQVVAPYLSGQRAVRRALLSAISDLEVSRFGVEIALTRYAKRTGSRVVEVELSDLTHRMKEEKLGLVRGFAARMRMYWEIVKYAGRR